MPSDFSLQSQSPDLPCSPVPTFSHQPCTYKTSPFQLLGFLPSLPLYSDIWNLEFKTCYLPVLNLCPYLLEFVFPACPSGLVYVCGQPQDPISFCTLIWSISPWTVSVCPSCLRLGPILVFPLVLQATNESSNMACQFLLCTEYLVF